jgi:hypothetical protein
VSKGEAIVVERLRKESYWLPLLTVATEHLEINSFEKTGQKLVDIRLLRVSDIANALERAYQIGLGAGYNVNESERV